MGKGKTKYKYKNTNVNAKVLKYYKIFHNKNGNKVGQRLASKQKVGFSPRVTHFEENSWNEKVGSNAKMRMTFSACLLQHTSFHNQG